MTFVNDACILYNMQRVNTKDYDYIITVRHLENWCNTQMYF